MILDHILASLGYVMLAIPPVAFAIFLLRAFYLMLRGPVAADPMQDLQERWPG